MASEFSSPLCFICFAETKNPPISSDGQLNDGPDTLCELLYLEPKVFKPHFENSTYCDSCLDHIHDAVMLMKSLASIQKRISDVRGKISRILLQNIESWFLGVEKQTPSGETRYKLDNFLFYSYYILYSCSIISM